MRLFPIPVLRHNTDKVRDAACGGQANEADADAVSRLVLWRILGKEAISGDDATNISKPNLPGCSNGATMVATEVHREPTDDDWHCTVAATRDHEKRPVFQMAVVVHGQEDCETCNGNGNWNQRKEETVPQTVREEGDDHGETEGSGPRRDGMKLRLYWAVSICFYDTRSKVSIAIRRYYEPHVH